MGDGGARFNEVLLLKRKERKKEKTRKEKERINEIIEISPI